MSLKLVCDGCETPLYTSDDNPRPLNTSELIIQGRRSNGICGPTPLPRGEFHWCLSCAKIAFQAVQDARLRAAGWTR